MISASAVGAGQAQGKRDGSRRGAVLAWGSASISGAERFGLDSLPWC